MWIVKKSADEQTMCICIFPYLCICICLSIGNAEKVKRGGGLWRFAVVMFFCWNVFILCLIIISVSPSSVPAWNHHVKPLQCLLKTPSIPSLSEVVDYSEDDDDDNGDDGKYDYELLSLKDTVDHIIIRSVERMTTRILRWWWWRRWWWRTCNENKWQRGWRHYN